MLSLRVVCLSAILLGAGACKQGLGDRCDIDSDCESGLLCSKGTNKVCGDPAFVVPDATVDLRDALVIPDARFRPDAGPVPLPDAPVIIVIDAPLDLDAPTTQDAPDAPLAIDAPSAVDAH